ncbi:hypothetical protein F5J12DRAFT_324951 [Pisolithus orientalis]|uniref:uncharacterized protein n=1 Tax=Pisolithus orientalis TaxID=936130 RepID=UPI002225171D|nr:uncharacterized protein F5J12DRAFT_324951 [Pisolithus orientalis]KAI5998387.1 hypothetical protein F5J12DRAFT_324951 [Pisolithus orientalis]
MRGLGSSMQDIGEVPVRLPNNREYVFVDTLGFNNPDRPARDTLNTIADWLERKYRGGALLTRVVYTHRITNPWMDGLLRESLDIFGCICVTKAAGRVQLVTTMWDRVKDPTAAETMVSQLEENFWKPLLNAGTRHMRFENSKQLVWDIVEDLGVEGQPLLFQQELVDATRNLYKMFAGHALYLQLQKLLLEEPETCEPFLGVFKTRKVRRPKKRLEVECERIEMQLRKARKERQRLEIRRHSY